MSETILTKRRVLEECLGLFRASRARMSQHHNGLVPLDGYETAFTAEGERCRVLQEMLQELSIQEERDRIDQFAEQNRQALEQPEVRRRIRDWQREIMEGKRPNLDDLKMDGGMEHAAVL